MISEISTTWSYLYMFEFATFWFSGSFISIIKYYTIWRWFKICIQVFIYKLYPTFNDRCFWSLYLFLCGSIDNWQLIWIWFNMYLQGSMDNWYLAFSISLSAEVYICYFMVWRFIYMQNQLLVCLRIVLDISIEFHVAFISGIEWYIIFRCLQLIFHGFMDHLYTELIESLFEDCFW